MSLDETPSLVERTLRAALRAVEGGDSALAIGMLAEVWSATRNGKLADIVMRAEAGEINLPRAPSEAREEEWARAWRTDAPARGALGRAPWPPTWRLALRRVEAMCSHPDPRAADILQGLAGRYLSDSAYPLWRRVARVLGDQGEARHVAFARSLELLVPAGPASYRALITGGPPAPVTLPADLEELVEALDRLLGGPRGGPDLAPLLEAVYEDAEDDEALLVYADALSAAGDPRGEFIRLQVAAVGAGEAGPALERRAAALLRRHGDRWVEGVGLGLLKEGRRFSRGFLVAGTWNDVGGSVAHPAWRLVEEVSVGRGVVSPLRAIFSHPLPRLRRLYGLDGLRVAELLATPYPERLTHLGYVPIANELPPAARFTALRELQVHEGPAVIPAAVMRQWPTVERWVFHHATYNLGNHGTWRPLPVVRTVVHAHWAGHFGPPQGWVTTLSRLAGEPEDGVMRGVHIRWGGGDRALLPLLAGILRGLPTLGSLTVEPPPGFDGAAADSARAETARLRGRWIAA